MPMSLIEQAAKSLVQPLEVARDKDGWWSHPGIPDFDENFEMYKAWIAAQGLETTYVTLDDEDDEHPARIAYFENADPDVSKWEPTPPAGDGWFTFSIHDTEDGPAWVWARRVETAPASTSSEAASPVLRPVRGSVMNTTPMTHVPIEAGNDTHINAPVNAHGNCFGLIPASGTWLDDLIDWGMRQFRRAADARRMAACWNACMAVSTEDLEQYYIAARGALAIGAADPDIKQLMTFYQANTLVDLVRGQSKHVMRLQARLPITEGAATLPPVREKTT